MNSRILLTENQVGSISTKMVIARKKTELQSKANSFSLSLRGTVKELKDRIEKYHENMKTLRTEKNFDVNILNFWDFGPSEPLSVPLHASAAHSSTMHETMQVKLS